MRPSSLLSYSTTSCDRLAFDGDKSGPDGYFGNNFRCCGPPTESIIDARLHKCLVYSHLAHDVRLQGLSTFPDMGGSVRIWITKVEDASLAQEVVK